MLCSEVVNVTYPAGHLGRTSTCLWGQCAALASSGDAASIPHSVSLQKHQKVIRTIHRDLKLENLLLSEEGASRVILYLSYVWSYSTQEGKGSYRGNDGTS